jgi:hypothetical protein
MKFHLFLTLPLISCFALVSCFPIPKEKPTKKSNEGANATLTSEEQQEIEKQRELLRQQELEKQAELTHQETPPTNQTQNTVVEPPTIKSKSDYPFGTPVPGKEGFVFSPYNNKLLDVRGIASGTLVQDTTYPPTEKKYFRVP